MRKILSFRVHSASAAALFLAAAVIIAPKTSLAAPLPFTADLSYGMRASAAVMQLQDFLRSEGYFTGDSTGNFLSVTRAAVMSWQGAHCVPATGYFGPISRQAAAEGTLCAASAPLPEAPSTTASAGDSILVTMNGAQYVRTTGGLVRVSGGQPNHSSPAAAPAPQTYAVTSSGDGHESIAPSTSQSVNDGSTQSFALTADSGYDLSSTVGGTCAAGSWSGSTYTTGAITADCSVSFSATPNAFALTVTKSGNSTGTVTSLSAGISCGSTCSASFPSGASVSLTATPDSGVNFGGWSGACSGTGFCTVTMDAAKSVNASFIVLIPT